MSKSAKESHGNSPVDLNDRGRSVLKATVISHIHSALPIGSRTITKQFDFGLSSATIRNIMADLADLGFLSQPHTSAGRIPTEKAYRFYVDLLLEEKPPAPVEDLENYRLSPSNDTEALLQQTSKMLSLLSRYTSIVTAPKIETMRLKHLKFISLRENIALAIFVTEDGQALNKTFDTETTVSQKELDRISAMINDRLARETLDELKMSLLKEAKEEKRRYEALLNKVFEFNGKHFSDAEEKRLFVEGATNIIDLPEFTDIEKIKSLLKAFEEKNTILKFLDRCLQAEGAAIGPQVFIGSENPFLQANECSLVIATYEAGTRNYGAVGVIGPIRMDYSRTISLVDYTAKMLTKINRG